MLLILACLSQTSPWGALSPGSFANWTEPCWDKRSGSLQRRPPRTDASYHRCPPHCPICVLYCSLRTPPLTASPRASACDESTASPSSIACTKQRSYHQAQCCQGRPSLALKHPLWPRSPARLHNPPFLPSLPRLTAPNNTRRQKENSASLQIDTLKSPLQYLVGNPENICQAGEDQRG